MKYLLILVSLFCFVSLLFAEPEHEARELNFEIMSPFCPGRALADCPTEAADELRSEICLRLDSGETKASILEDIIKKYGEQFRAAPKREGFGMFAYLIPALLFISGIVIIIFFIRSNKKQTRNL